MNGRTAHGMQIFVILPAVHKHAAAGTEHVVQADMPEWRTGDGHARLVFGSYDCHISLLVTLSQATLVDLVVAVTGTATLTIPVGQQAFVLMAAGEVTIAEDSVTRERGMAFGQAEMVRNIPMKALAKARVTLHLGTPIHGPVVWGGQFVMTSAEENPLGTLELCGRQDGPEGTD
jgi:quercetin 2,3-dioxygenase